jgi:hypothetical protein
MEQKDFILREIEKIGRLLRVLINKLLKREEYPESGEYNEYTNICNSMKVETGFDLENFLEMDEEDSFAYLKSKREFNIENLESLATLLERAGEVFNWKKEAMLNKAIFVINYCNEKDKTFSFEREDRLKKLKYELLRTC